VPNRRTDRTERVASASISGIAVGYAMRSVGWDMALAEIAYIMVRFRIPADRRPLVLSHALHGYADADDWRADKVVDLLTAAGADVELARWIRRELCDSRH
jgi:hypothetical protein